MRVIDDSTIVPAVSVAQFKQSIHVLAEDVDDDTVFSINLAAACELVELASNRPLSPRTVEFIIPFNGWVRWWFPVAPVSALVEIATRNEAGVWVVHDHSEFILHQPFDEPCLEIPVGWSGVATWPSAVRVRALAGYQATELPQTLRQAIILLAKEWFEAGIALEETQVPHLTFGISRLIRQRRYRRPCIVSETGS
jgi:uncharacterized phiE125 gp8 family phage protein